MKSRSMTVDAMHSVCDLLNQQIMDTIRVYLKVRMSSEGIRSSQAGAVLEGISQDLLETIKLISARIDALGGHECAAVQWNRRGTRSDGALPDTGEIRSRLHSLLASYSTYESSVLKTARAVHGLGDPVSGLLLERIAACTARNFWLIEIHLEALISGPHGGKLPEWEPALRQDWDDFGRNGNGCSHGI